MAREEANKKRKKQEKYYRKFEVVEYDEAEASRIIDLVKADYEEGWIKDYAYATHDQDKYIRGVDAPDKVMAKGKKFGDDKDKHVHIGFVWYTPATISSIANKLHVAKNFVERIKSPRFGDYLSYLTHKNAPEKHQYDDSIVQTSIIDWKEQRDATLDAKKLKAMESMYPHYLTMVTKGELKRKDIGSKLPAEVYATHRSALDTAFDQRNKMEAKMRNATNTVNKIIYFITGKSGSGKTTYAKVMATKQGMDYFQVGSGNDLLDGYQGEECLILDDVRGHNFTYEDLLKLIDPNSISLYKSRYSNKLITSKLIVLTSIQSLEDFIKDIENSKKEDSFQIERRISMVLSMDDHVIHTWKYDQSSKCYRNLGDRENPVKEFVEKHQEEEIRPESFLW